MSASAAAKTLWERAIILVDMNAFFAAIEQRDRPELQGRPIAITNGQTGTCIITASYEARRYGVRTGMRLRQARRLCPDLLQVASRPERYAEVSRRIMAALTAITPDIEIFSIDEAFLDVTGCQALLGSPEVIARRVQQTVLEASGLPCSVGLSGDKSTAKWAAEQRKPNGITVVPPWQAAQRLQAVPVTELCGVGSRIGDYLARRGVHTCGDMARLPVSELGRRFGNMGRRIWLMAQGLDPTPVESRATPPKSIGHGKVMPPGGCDAEGVLTYLDHMSFKVATRLRRHDMVAQRFFIGLRAEQGWLGGTFRCALPTSDGSEIMGLCHQMVARHWQGQGVFQVQVTALDPRPTAGQLDLFNAPSPRSARTGAVIDAINRRYGECSLTPARLLQRSEMPNVIAPSWRPDGVRQSL